MEFELNDSQQMIQNMARDFAEKNVASRIEEIERDRICPHDLFMKMADAGFLGLTFPEKYGGSDLGYDHWVLAMEQIAKVSASVATTFQVATLFLETLRTCGSDEQIDYYLAAGIRGDYIGSSAFTEPGTGSDPRQLITTYRKEGDYYIINGTKRFITGAGYKGPILIFAKDAENGEVSTFITEKFCEGYSLSTPWGAIGWKGSALYDVFLDNVKVRTEDSNILGPIGKGFENILDSVSFGKVGLAAISLGTMLASYEAAIKYSKEKMHRDRSISKFQAIQLKISRIAAMYESARWMVYKLGVDASNIRDPKEYKAHVAVVKAYVTDLAPKCNFMAMNILGAYGVTEEYNVERFMRDSLVTPHVEGVNDINRVISGKYILK